MRIDEKARGRYFAVAKPPPKDFLYTGGFTAAKPPLEKLRIDEKGRGSDERIERIQTIVFSHRTSL